MATNRPASVKYSLEIARWMKGKKVQQAEQFLHDVVAEKRPLMLQTYHKKVPHRVGNAYNATKAGRYPWKTCEVWLDLLNSVKANADVKGLDTKKLRVVHANATHGFSRITYQKQGRISNKARKSKSAHIEIIVREVKA
jgi:large subunit ribosomal protein L22